MRDDLTHFDDCGHPVMVDVSGKPATVRRAVASGHVVMSEAALEQALSRGGKGDVLLTAELAGIAGAKQTSALIPLCHNLALTNVSLRIAPDRDLPGLVVTAEAGATGPTGVEMEAMTAICIACLTIYDMLKAVDRGMVIGAVRLLEKSGGGSGVFRRGEAA